MPEFASYPSLKDAVVFITGGASGIGEQIVRAFAGQGSKVGFVDLDAEGGKALAEELAGGGTTIHFEAADLRDIDALKEAFAGLQAALGPATVLVNNAARDDRHGWEDVTPDYYDERIATNLRHMFFAIQAVAPGMIEAGGGSIVNFGSNSWWEAGGGMPVYTSSKAAVHGMTRSFARDLGPHRVRVNTVVPGWIMTERQKQLWVTPEAIEKHRDRQCLKELIEPVYLARMVLFLASDDAAMCTANNYMVEAGSICAHAWRSDRCKRPADRRLERLDSDQRMAMYLVRERITRFLSGNEVKKDPLMIVIASPPAGGDRTAA